MNYDRFVAANGMALLTHTLVSHLSLCSLIVDLNFRPNQWIWSKQEHKCFKKEKVSVVLVSREDSTLETFITKFQPQEVDLRSFIHALTLSL